MIFITLIINRYNDWLFPTLRQFFLFPNGISKFMYFRMYCPTSCLNQFFWNLTNIWRSVSLQIYNHSFSLKDTKHSVVCISACLRTLTWRTSNNRHKWLFHPTKYCQNLQAGYKFNCRLAICVKVFNMPPFYIKAESNNPKECKALLQK